MKIKKHWSTIGTKQKQYAVALVIIALSATAGAVYLTVSHAATPTASVNAAAGTISGCASSITDTSAYSGKAVKFGACATSPKLIFDDEFNGAAGSAPDPTKWSVMGGTSPSRWGVECFVNDRTHIYIDGQGHLVQTATYNPGGVPCTNGSGLYESGGMTTGNVGTGQFSYLFGSAVASIKVPCQSGTGIWPAWWADGANWPNGGEIDYLEMMKGTSAGYNAQQTLHGPSTTASSWQYGFGNTSSTLWCNSYHTYGANWSKGKIDFTIDGVVVHTATPANVPAGGTWPFDTNPERLLLDLQIGSWGGTVDNTTLPQSMLVDYVRVYQ